MNDTPANEEAISWFAALRDEDVTEAQWLAFEAWLEADEANRADYDEIERLWIALDGAAATEAPANDDAFRPGPKRSRTWFAPALAIAASLLLVVGIWPTMADRFAVQHYETQAEGRTVVLKDGSTVQLNRHTEIAVRLKDDLREVTLTDGEASFDVIHMATRPFVVNSGDHSVRVLGTAFNVLSHDGNFSVAVQRGAVAVKPGVEHAVVRLLAGQALEQEGANSPILSTIDPELASGWREGVLVFREASLDDVARDLSRYLDKPVIVSDQTKSLKFTGVLQVGDEATMLRQLEEFLPIQSTRSATDVRLTARGGR